MARRGLTPEDLFQLRVVSDPQLSPDGTRIAYVETTMKRDTNTYQSRIWIVSTSSLGKPYLLTSEPAFNFAPRWSPDGKWLAFISMCDDCSQLWIIPSVGGEARMLTSLRNIGGAPVWAPDSRTIAFVAYVGADGPDEGNQRERTPRERFSEDVIVIDKLWYKLDHFGFLVEKHWHLFTISVTGPDKEKLKQLTFGDDDYASPAWSPDGRYIAFAGHRIPDGIGLTLVNDIWVVPSTGGKLRRLTRSLGPADHPSWSPDGRVIAYIGHHRRHGHYTFPGIWLVPASGGEPRELTTDFPHAVGNHSIRDIRGYKEPAVAPVWAPDGRSIYTSASAQGSVNLWRLSISDGKAVQLTRGNRVIYSLSFSEDARRVAMAVTTTTLPGDVWVGDVTGTGIRERRITEVNRDWLGSVIISEPIRYSFQSSDGPEAEGWILYPSGRPRFDKIPAVLQIHGGPMVMYGHAFFFEFQLLATNGFAVIYSNPRGSFGYGQEFAAAIRGDWGHYDYTDVMAAVDSALAKGGLDGKRLGVAGGSYGGYLTNWIITQTERFKAAVSMRSISNLYSFFGTSDGGFLSADDYGGPPWVLREEYMKQSPISYVANVRTPLLVIHSDLDFRTPIEQGEQFYTALKFLGRNVRFVRFRTETHELSRSGAPWHRVIRLEHILNWFQEHLKRTTGTTVWFRRTEEPE